MTHDDRGLYRLAHQLLPTQFLIWKLDLAELASPERAAVVHKVLSQGEEAPLPPFGLSLVHVAGTPGLLVELPEPRISPEAYYALAIPTSAEARRRYFTLERTGDNLPEQLQVAGAAVVGEWQRTPDPRHVNHGQVVGTDAATFLRAVAELLA